MGRGEGGTYLLVGRRSHTSAPEPLTMMHRSQEAFLRACQMVQLEGDQLLMGEGSVEAQEAVQTLMEKVQIEPEFFLEYKDTRDRGVRERDERRSRFCVISLIQGADDLNTLDLSVVRDGARAMFLNFAEPASSGSLRHYILREYPMDVLYPARDQKEKEAPLFAAQIGADLEYLQSYSTAYADTFSLGGDNRYKIMRRAVQWTQRGLNQEWFPKNKNRSVMSFDSYAVDFFECFDLSVSIDHIITSQDQNKIAKRLADSFQENPSHDAEEIRERIAQAMLHHLDEILLEQIQNTYDSFHSAVEAVTGSRPESLSRHDLAQAIHASHTKGEKPSKERVREAFGSLVS